MAIIYDSVVPPADLTAFARSVPVDQTYVLNQILPDKVDPILRVDIGGETTITTRAAKARAFDAPPMPGQRDTLESRSVRLPAVSQMLDQGELDRLKLEEFTTTGGSSAAAIERALYDDTENNVRSVLARVEMMRGDLLDDGAVTLSEMGGMTADFGTPSTHKVTAATLWSNTASADILGNIRGWNQVYRQSNGFRFGGMWMSEDVLYSMLQNEAIRDLWPTVSGSPSLITLDQLNQTLQSNLLPPVLGTYDAQAIVDGTATDILPGNKVIFVPPRGITLGFTQWGMTATALELQGSKVKIDPSPAGMIAIEDKDVRPPFRRAAYVDSTVLPVLERPKGLFVAQVLS